MFWDKLADTFEGQEVEEGNTLFDFCTFVNRTDVLTRKVGKKFQILDSM